MKCFDCGRELGNHTWSVCFERDDVGMILKDFCSFGCLRHSVNSGAVRQSIELNVDMIDLVVEEEEG